jgi:hypothetical protein
MPFSDGHSGTIFDHKLAALGGPPARSCRVYRQVVLVVLVCIQSLRQIHFVLWQQGMDGTGRHVDPDDRAEMDRRGNQLVFDRPAEEHLDPRHVASTVSAAATGGRRWTSHRAISRSDSIRLASVPCGPS